MKKIIYLILSFIALLVFARIFIPNTKGFGMLGVALGFIFAIELRLNLPVFERWLKEDIWNMEEEILNLKFQGHVSHK